MTVNAIDLFCGAGGSSRGATDAGATLSCGIDAWDMAVESYGLNFPEALGLRRKIASGMRMDFLSNLGSIDLILASPECTNHSCAKGGKPRDDESLRTAYRVLDFVSEIEPRWVVIENVVNMRSWSGYARLLKTLKAQYHVRAQILDAADFGVPQNRKRLFLICDRMKEPAAIQPLIGRRPTTVRDILDRKGAWPSRPLTSKNHAANTMARAERAISALGRGVPFLIVYYGSDGAGGWQPLDRPIRTLTTLDRFGLVTWDGDTPLLRMLQVPELKRAMGFPDDHQLAPPTRRERIKLLGNAVCPPVMKAVVTSLCR